MKPASSPNVRVLQLAVKGRLRGNKTANEEERDREEEVVRSDLRRDLLEVWASSITGLKGRRDGELDADRVPLVLF